MHRPTIEVYERESGAYAAQRSVQHEGRVRAFAAAMPADGLRLDLGCGPGHYLPLLGRPAIAADAARAMVLACGQQYPDVAAVQADLIDLPFDRGALDGVWASKAHQHLAAADLPMALADVHRVLAVGGRFDLTMFAALPGQPTSEEVSTPGSGDDFPGRLFTWWDPDHLAAVLAAAGFRVDHLELRPTETADDHARVEITAIAERALPDHVRAGMRLLCCGLNPSLHAADAGVGYVTGSNRFWRAMDAAGLATKARDPRHLLRHDHIGMTDLVKRATARADELRAAEYRDGVDRLAQLCAWLRPGAVAVVGLAGWRAAVDRKAAAGWQPNDLGGSPVYVLPSTSGLNAGVSLEALTGHLLAAAGVRN